MWGQVWKELPWIGNKVSGKFPRVSLWHWGLRMHIWGKLCQHLFKKKKKTWMERMLTRTDQLGPLFQFFLLRRQPRQWPYYCRNSQSRHSAFVSWVAFGYKNGMLFCLRWCSPENSLGSELFYGLISVGTYCGRVELGEVSLLYERSLTRRQIALEGLHI